MKKFLIFLIPVVWLTACDLFTNGTHDNTLVQFTFVDANGKDIFADSMSVDDFQITSLEGYAAFDRAYTIHEKHRFSISFGEGRDGDEKSVTLFHLKDDIDTAVVTFKDSYTIRNLYYNGEKFRFESDLYNDCTIVK